MTISNIYLLLAISAISSNNIKGIAIFATTAFTILPLLLVYKKKKIPYTSISPLLPFLNIPLFLLDTPENLWQVILITFFSAKTLHLPKKQAILLIILSTSYALLIISKLPPFIALLQWWSIYLIAIVLKHSKLFSTNIYFIIVETLSLITTTLVISLLNLTKNSTNVTFLLLLSTAVALYIILDLEEKLLTLTSQKKDLLDALGISFELTKIHLDETQFIKNLLLQIKKVFPANWIEIILGEGKEDERFYLSPSEKVFKGRARIPEKPPPLPGFHRIIGWKTLNYSITIKQYAKMGEIIIWYDPRIARTADIERLNNLMVGILATIEKYYLAKVASTDTLLDTSNRRVLEAYLGSYFTRIYKKGGSVGVIVLDIDHFKKINDTYGHSVGDNVLKHVLNIIKNSLRPTDLVARYGGEEFVIVIPEANGELITNIAERIRSNIEKNPFVHGRKEIRITVSCGVAAFPDILVKSYLQLIDFADKALYKAKSEGRNKVFHYVGKDTYYSPSLEVQD